MRKGDFVAWYVALAHSAEATKTSLHEYPPGIANVTINDGTDTDLTGFGELPLDYLRELGAPGVFFNAKTAAEGANLRLDRASRLIHNGLLYIPFYATRNIMEGEGGYWDYQPDKGLGGADSYHFDDSVFGIRKLEMKEHVQADASSAGL
jgi:hypothetical protein